MIPIVPLFGTSITMPEKMTPSGRQVLAADLAQALNDSFEKQVAFLLTENREVVDTIFSDIQDLKQEILVVCEVLRKRFQDFPVRRAHIMCWQRRWLEILENDPKKCSGALDLGEAISLYNARTLRMDLRA